VCRQESIPWQAKIKPPPLVRDRLHSWQSRQSIPEASGPSLCLVVPNMHQSLCRKPRSTCTSHVYLHSMGMLSLCDALHAGAVSATNPSRHAVPLQPFGKHVRSSKHSKHSSALVVARSAWPASSSCSLVCFALKVGQACAAQARFAARLVFGQLSCHATRSLSMLLQSLIN